MEDIHLIQRVAKATARQHFWDRFAKLLLSMSLNQAKTVLGFPPEYNPNPVEIQKAYRIKALENHPDRGGSHEKMVEVNAAKEILEGKGRATWTPDPSYSARPERPRAPKWQDDPETVYMKGQDFAAGMASSGAPADTEWKFVSIPEWYYEKSFYPGHRVWVLYGQTSSKHIFLAIKERGESAGIIPTDLGPKTHVEADWQTSLIDTPISHNISKIAPKLIKSVGSSWADGAKFKPARKFIAWSGGKPTEPVIEKIPRSGGVALKDILVSTGLLNDDDPSVAGRKSIVEIYTKYSKERFARAKKLKAEGKLKNLNNAHQYDFFVRINGKEAQLEDDTITKMERTFIPFAMNWEVSEGRPKNLTRMRGGTLKHDAASAIRELANCLTSEPSWLHIALEKAAEEWEDESPQAKAASVGLIEAAIYFGVDPYDILYG